ncbi:3-hydroxyacyl-CoA dehydrogenase [Paralimibaculum aggregatum]|uniref:3-hydroxyacyl-CoA dehydrogenase n=1 Tax=Paralimibaculum aggregatum TaxID=3036245 RepID=A0ABQ6LQQ0_9RHOB|nr:3-hydroxyacyl-CoA dehydrogenase [Limibaculum sp. NKW23]GMG83498.1 3-hydroxyacyl-CoA dehydrogenase [Limibaculum sp. NKW23]
MVSAGASASDPVAGPVVGIVGAGAMGQGIAQVAAQGGLRVLLQDARAGAAAAGREAVAARLARLVEKGRINAAAESAALARIEAVAGIAELAPAGLVIEAVVEDLEVKRAVFREIEAAVAPDCLIASNTSSIPVRSIARDCAHRGRVAGMHFFNPVPLMRLVELVRTVWTSEETLARLAALGRRMGRTPVVVQDSPGFLVNLGGRAFTTEALRIAQERVATPAEIDAIMRDCWGFRMGPFELLDLTGMDVNYPVTRIVWEGFGHDPRLATTPAHRAMAEAGLLGRKTGEGWYSYAGGRAADPPSPDWQGEAAPARRAALAGEAPALAALCRAAGLAVGADDGACPILAAPFGADATAVAVESGADHRRLVCLDLAGPNAGAPAARITLMTAPGADPAIRGAVAAALVAAGRKVTAITDSPGFVGQRICAMVANLGCAMAETGIATPEDIDTAMTLGLNYPQGPLALAETMGRERCLEVLDRLQAVTGEDRYRASPWLRRRAALGLPVQTPA